MFFVWLIGCCFFHLVSRNLTQQFVVVVVVVVVCWFVCLFCFLDFVSP